MRYHKVGSRMIAGSDAPIKVGEVLHLVFPFEGKLQMGGHVYAAPEGRVHIPKERLQAENTPYYLSRGNTYPCETLVWQNEYITPKGDDPRTLVLTMAREVELLKTCVTCLEAKLKNHEWEGHNAHLFC